GDAVAALTADRGNGGAAAFDVHRERSIGGEDRELGDALGGEERLQFGVVLADGEERLDSVLGEAAQAGAQAQARDVAGVAGRWSGEDAAGDDQEGRLLLDAQLDQLVPGAQRRGGEQVAGRVREAADAGERRVEAESGRMDEMES